MEAKVIKVFDGHRSLAVHAHFLGLALESLESLAKCIQVHFDRLVSIDRWVLRERIWLVEVVAMINKGAPAVVEYDRGVGTQKHGDCAETSSGPGIAFWIHSDVRGNKYGVATVPGL